MTGENIGAIHLQAQKMLNQGDFKQAHQLCLSVIRLSPKHADAHFLLGMIAFNLQQMTKAIGLIEFAITQDPNNVEYYTFLARSLSLVNRYKEASIAVELALNLGSKSALLNDTLGVVLSRLGDHKKAVTLFTRAIELQPNNPNYYYNLASSLKFLGSFEAAEQAYEKVISLKPDYYQAHSALSELLKSTKEKNNIKRLQSLLAKTTRNVNGQLHLCHALSKEYECLGEYDKALDFLSKGNGAKKVELEYEFDRDAMLFDSVKACFESDFSTRVDIGNSSSKPIFVIGMPRSGTTLVDRILSSHDSVVSAGELQNFGVELKKMTMTRSNNVLDTETIHKAQEINFEQLGSRYIEGIGPMTDSQPHFIDKMPLNFLYIGFIKKALPNAKIIILKRNAMDTCVSNFRTLFAVNFSYYNYAYDLMDTGKYFARFDDLVRFWKSLYGDEILEVSYEDLVSKPEEHVRQLLNYCDLEWQSQCLNFHENKAPVSTASSVQVRQPLNNKSIGRWKRYGDKLTPLKSFLESKNLL
jgi:tetratricopeptide (TPR) repeat protein